MKILLTGATGQVGYELERSLQGLGQVIAPGRAQLDLSRLDQVRDVIRDLKPDLIVNPAAYTAVDLAESEAAFAMRINGEAPAVMAEEARRLGAAMIQYSTDYVFDGTKAGRYREDDPTNPLGVYGQTKLAGEQAVQAAGIPHLILRTSWVYGMRGKNFLLTMLRLAKERPELRIVNDQRGAPTWSRTIADTTAHILAQASHAGAPWWDAHSGLYHLTATGDTSWFGFTEAILAQAGLSCSLVPIGTTEYPTPARRPSNSRLSCDKLRSQFCDMPHWKDSLRLCMS